MAYIHPYKDGWRAQVYRHGIRKSKTFVTRADAESWGAMLDGMTKKQLHGWSTMKERVDLVQTALMTSIPARVLEANAAIPYKHKEVLEAAIPLPAASGIYFLIKGLEVVYVGQSLDVLHRIARHRREGREFDGYAHITCPPERLDEMESQYIAAFAPRLNSTFGRKAA
jgi:hypothetical protein